MDSKEAARLIRAKSRKTITLPASGATMIIRKLQPYDFLGAKGMSDRIMKRLEIPTQSLTAGGEGIGPAVARDLEFEEVYMKHIVSKAAVEPRVVLDREPAEDEVAFSDLGDDAEYILTQAIEFSGLGDKAEVVERFREAEGKEPAGN